MKPKPKCKRTADDRDWMEDKFIKGLMQFYNIKLKTEEEVNELPIKRQRQYESRYKRWDRLMTSLIECEIYRSRSMFDSFDEAILETDRKLRDQLNDPEFESKDEIHKRKVKRDQMQLNEVVKQLKSDRSKFDHLLKQFKTMKEEDKTREEEDGRITREEEEAAINKAKYKLGIKDEVISDDDQAMDVDRGSDSDTDVEIKEEIEVKEEYESEEHSSEEDDKERVRRQIKREAKKEIKTETDVKPRIKREVKKEVRWEVKPDVKYEDLKEVKVKKEYISSDDDV